MYPGTRYGSADRLQCHCVAIYVGQLGLFLNSVPGLRGAERVFWGPHITAPRSLVMMANKLNHL